MSIYKNDVKYEIAQKLFEYYVMNDKYVAVQMPDGKYKLLFPDKLHSLQ